MKYLMVMAVVGVLLWLMLGRNRRVGGGGDRGKGAAAGPAAPVEMVECAHCKVHLPRTDARFDAGGRPYCGDPHRLAGPR